MKYNKSTAHHQHHKFELKRITFRFQTRNKMQSFYHARIISNVQPKISADNFWKQINIKIYKIVIREIYIPDKKKCGKWQCLPAKDM